MTKAAVMSSAPHSSPPHKMARRGLATVVADSIEAPTLVSARRGLGLVDELVELAAVHHLDEGCGMCGIGHNPDGGRVLNADLLPECVVRLHLLRQLAHGIDGEGQCDLVRV